MGRALDEAVVGLYFGELSDLCTRPVNARTHGRDGTRVTRGKQ